MPVHTGSAPLITCISCGSCACGLLTRVVAGANGVRISTCCRRPVFSCKDPVVPACCGLQGLQAHQLTTFTSFTRENIDLTVYIVKQEARRFTRYDNWLKWLL